MAFVVWPSGQCTTMSAAWLRWRSAHGWWVKTLAEVEDGYIDAVLRAHGGNRARAAAQLEVAPATLYRKLAARRART